MAAVNIDVDRHNDHRDKRYFGRRSAEHPFRMIESHRELEGYENDLACFHTLEEAKYWLSLPTR